MIRVLIGSIASAVAIFVIGFVFYGTPLNKLHVGGLDNARAAEVQRTLAANLPATGTYHVPSTATSEQTIMYGQGPVATIHYNSNGFAAPEPGALAGGLLLDFLVSVLMGAALIGIDRRVPDFGSRARVVGIFAVAASAYMHLGEPIWYHHDWPHFLYMFVADAAALAVGGMILARWFLPVKAVPGTYSRRDDLSAQ